MQLCPQIRGGAIKDHSSRQRLLTFPVGLARESRNKPLDILSFAPGTDRLLLLMLGEGLYHRKGVLARFAVILVSRHPFSSHFENANLPPQSLLSPNDRSWLE